jgi:hypothetical protein
MSTAQTRIKTTTKQMQLLRQGMDNVRHIPTMVLPRLGIGTIRKPVTNTIKLQNNSC